MSNDAQKVQEVILGVHVLWGAPALIIVILILLYQQVGRSGSRVGGGGGGGRGLVGGCRLQLRHESCQRVGTERPQLNSIPSSLPRPPPHRQVGWATFVGLAVMLVYTPLSAKVSRKLIEFRRTLMKWTDIRVGLMNEIINGMQVGGCEVQGGGV